MTGYALLRKKKIISGDLSTLQKIKKPGDKVVYTDSSIHHRIYYRGKTV